MTQKLMPGSIRRAGAAKFAAALREAMKDRSVGQVRLSKAAGVSAAAIANYRMGHNIPTMETATRLAEALGASHLVTIAQAARTVLCENCGTGVVIEAGSPRRFCTTECQRLAQAKRGPNPARGRGIVAERAVARYRAAVSAMCWGCEPQGLCRTADCELRPVSPLSLASFETGTTLPIAPRTSNTPTWRLAVLEANARRWTPEAKARQAEINRQRFASMTDEEREDFRASVSAGRKKSA